MSRWLPLARSSCSPSPRPARPGRRPGPVTHGVVVGDVSAGSAVLWARADRQATLQVGLSGGAHRSIEPVTVRARRLPAACGSGARAASSTTTASGSGRRPERPGVVGSFWTPPAGDESGAGPARLRRRDVAGQNVCRDAAEGFPIMDTIRSRKPHVLVGLGDMIYADNGCDPTGRYGTRSSEDSGSRPTSARFWSHWRYNRADPASKRLLGARATSACGTTTRSSTTSGRYGRADDAAVHWASTSFRSGSRRSSTTRRSRARPCIARSAGEGTSSSSCSTPAACATRTSPRTPGRSRSRCSDANSSPG